MMWVLSKCYFEQYGVRSANLIIPNMYGPFDSTNPNKTHALNALIIKFLKAIKYNQKEVEIWGTGKPVREWLYVRDFAKIVLQVILRDESFIDPINIAQDHGETVNELVKTIQEKVHFTGQLTYNSKYQDGSPKKVMDDRLFRLKYPGFRFTPLETGITETIEYYRAIL